jgi:hypothetical protein
MLGPRRPALRHLARQIVGEFARHVGARSMARRQVSLCQQLFVRKQGRGSRNAKILRERARRWQPRAGREDAIENRATDGRVHLLLEALTPTSVYPNHQVGRRRRQVAS